MNPQALKNAVSLKRICEDDGIKFRKSGNRLKALCPFHNENTPSFVVFPDDHFHCYGCHAHGTIIDYVCLRDKVDFRRSYIWIAENYAPTLVDAEATTAIRKQNEDAAQERKTLISAIEDARRVFGGMTDPVSQARAHQITEATKNLDCMDNDDLYTLIRFYVSEDVAGENLKEFHPEYFKKTQPNDETTKRFPLHSEDLQNWLDDHEITIRYNVITKETEFLGMEQFTTQTEGAADNYVAILRDEVTRQYSCSRDVFRDLIEIIAGKNPYNPVLDKLSAQVWDGVDRLNTLYKILHLSPDDELSRTLVKKWCIQCISLQYNTLSAPFGGDGVLVLHGAQGIGKTRFANIISMDSRLFKEGINLTAADKDSQIQDTSAWIAEFGELGGVMRRADSDYFKQFITRHTDEYRKHYGHHSVKYPRRTSYIGTVNDDVFLVDPTGSRRWWVVDTPGIDLETLEHNFDVLQFWLQIKSYSDADRRSFRLSEDERKALLERNSKYDKPLRAEEEIRDIFAEAFSNPTFFHFIFTTITKFKEDHDSLSHYSTDTIGKVLAKLRDEFVIEHSTSISAEIATAQGLQNRRGRFQKLPMHTYRKTSVFDTSQKNSKED